VIDAATEIARPLMDERRHQLQVHLPAEAIYVEADPLRLAQVLANLLTNAAKYTDPGGQISVTVELGGADVVMRVQDNGIGIPPEMLPQVFEMFTQGTSRSTHTAGLGIGLALVRGLLSLHGGTIEAKSAGAGCGSEFIVKMPVGNHSDSDDASEGASEQSLPPATRRRYRVLVADDNRDAAVSLEILLSGDGYEVRTVHDGRAALEAAEAFRPHVAILDIGMPELNGLQVAEHIRAQTWGRGVHLIALTGWGQAEDRRRALEAGFDQHVTKPLEPDQLESLLSKVDGLI
jgi:CheY-like chemotaxis protein/anti-sigma regulatory factor (Ser/Thr protein kinase)